MRYKEQLNKEENQQVLKKVYRSVIDRKTKRCHICPPHAGENASRKPKHGTQKPRKRLRRGNRIHS